MSSMTDHTLKSFLDLDLNFNYKTSIIIYCEDFWCRPYNINPLISYDLNTVISVCDY